MAKRARSSSSSLTGGTGDVNPQWFRFPEITATTVDAVVSQTVNTPLNAFNQSSGGRATVMELLKVNFEDSTTFLPGITTTTQVADKKMGIYLGNQDVSTNEIGRGMAAPRCQAHQSVRLTIAPPGQPGDVMPVISQEEYLLDLTDGAGHGILIATPSLTFANSIFTTGPGTIQQSFRVAAFLFRFKEIDLTEFLGILQSQQVAGV